MEERINTKPSPELAPELTFELGIHEFFFVLVLFEVEIPQTESSYIRVIVFSYHSSTLDAGLDG